MRTLRLLAMATLDTLGVGLVVWAAWLTSHALGFLIAGASALVVAIVVTPEPRRPEGDAPGSES